MHNIFYYDAVRKLIALAREAQHSVEDKDRPGYIEEFCTVVIKGPRRSGHSTAVKDLARLYDAMIMVLTLDRAKSQYKDWDKICSPGSINRVRGVRANVVLCDGVGPLSLEEQAMLYSMSYGSDTFVIVHVG